MTWLLALTNAGLVFVLTLPGPPRPYLPWTVQEEPVRKPGSVLSDGPDWWRRLIASQAELSGRAGLSWPPQHLLLVRGAVMGMSAIASGWLLGPVAFLCGAAAGGLLLHEWLRGRAEQRLLRAAEQFREALQSVASSLRAGRSMPLALEQAHRDLVRMPGRSGDLLVTELARMTNDLQLGASLDSVLKGFATRVPLEEVRLFADAVSICRTHGGNLVEVLQTLVRLNIDRFQVRQEVRVQTSQKRSEGALISAMPLVMLLLLTTIAPDYMAPLTDTFLGQALVGVGLLMVLIAYLVTQSFTRIDF